MFYPHTCIASLVITILYWSGTFDNSPFSDVSLASIFSVSDLLFFFLIVSFLKQKMLNVMKHSLSILFYFFMHHTFGNTKKSLSSSKPVICFELIFVKGGRAVCRLIFFFFACNGCLFKHHLLKGRSLHHFIVFAPLSKICWFYLCGSMLEQYPVPLN